MKNIAAIIVIALFLIQGYPKIVEFVDGGVALVLLMSLSAACVVVVATWISERRRLSKYRVWKESDYDKYEYIEYLHHKVVPINYSEIVLNDASYVYVGTLADRLANDMLDKLITWELAIELIARKFPGSTAEEYARILNRAMFENR